jgi:hypothetical protein
MATYYVDYEGAAGSGNGTSYANRAGMVYDIQSSISAGDTIRIKKTADPTSLGTGEVVLAPDCDYNGYSKSGSNITYSSTDGETKLTSMGQGWITGDIIHVSHPDTTAGKSISGLWRVTLEAGTETNATLKLDNFPGTTGSSSTTFKYFTCVNAIYLNTDNLTKSIACRDAYRDAWTAGSNVTASYSHPTYSSWSTGYDYTLFTGADYISVHSSAGAGKAAHYELPSTLDLSGYQQVSFAFKANQTNTSVADTDFSLRLCTDTAGDTSVHTIPIQFKRQKTNTWTNRTIDLGTNLNASIKSIAIYKDNASATSVNFYFQNVIACKADSSADSITLDKLVGLNTAADPAWYPIAAIWDNIIYLDVSRRGRAQWGYYGSNAAQFSASNSSATIYQRKQHRADNSKVTQDDNFGWEEYAGASGTEANPITISGGWDDTNMSTRNGKTCVLLNDRMIPFYSTRDHIHWEHLYASHCGRLWHQNVTEGVGFTACGFSKYERGFYVNTTATATKFGIDFIVSNGDGYSFNFREMSFTGATLSDFYVKSACGQGHNGAIVYVNNASSVKFATLNLVGCGSRPVYVTDNATCSTSTLSFGYNHSTNSYPYAAGTGFFQADVYNAKNIYYQTMYTANTGRLHIGDFNRTITLQTETNSGGTYRRYGHYRAESYTAFCGGGEIIIMDAGIIAASVYNSGGSIKIKDAMTASGAFDNYYVASGKVTQEINYGNTGVNRALFGGFTVTPETSVRHTASGVSWKGTGSGSATFSLGKIVANADAAVTVGLWTYKTSSSGKVTLKIPGDISKGLTLQTVDNSSASVNTWTKIEKTFTPTESGAISVEVEMNSGGSSSQYVYIDDLEVSQA